MMVMRLIDKTSGLIMFDGEDIGAIPARHFATLPQRKRIQMVFQDPTDSLNPRFTARAPSPIRSCGWATSARDEVRARCEELAPQVGLPLESARPLSASAFRRPEGARRHRARDRARARSLILDEPTAALDVSVQAVVLNLLQDLKDSSA